MEHHWTEQLGIYQSTDKIMNNSHLIKYIVSRFERIRDPESNQVKILVGFDVCSETCVVVTEEVAAKSDPEIVQLAYSQHKKSIDKIKTKLTESWIVGSEFIPPAE